VAERGAHANGAAPATGADGRAEDATGDTVSTGPVTASSAVDRRPDGDVTGSSTVDGAVAERPAAAVPMADVMADMPGVWRRLLAAHVPDRLGRCRGCRSDTGSGERWPCSLYRIATEARRLHDHKLTQAIDND
jgi:hypothetical protein